MKTSYETANIDRYNKIIRFCQLYGLEYETKYRPTYFKRYAIYFTIPAVLIPAYNDYINKNHLF